MFDIGWSELVVIGIVALIAIGPKELPGVLRAAGQWVGKMRRLAAEFQGQFQEAMREAEMADLKKQFEEVGDIARDLDPFATVQKEIQSAVEDKPAASADSGAPATGASEITPTGESASPADTAAAVAQSTAGETAVTANIPLPEAAPPVTEADFAESQPKPKARAKRKPKAPKVEAEDESA